jgi:hypothetical protein
MSRSGLIGACFVLVWPVPWVNPCDPALVVARSKGATLNVVFNPASLVFVEELAISSKQVLKHPAKFDSSIGMLQPEHQLSAQVLVFGLLSELVVFAWIEQLEQALTISLVVVISIFEDRLQVCHIF